MSHIILTPDLTITAGCLFIPTCTLVVALRFYTRYLQKAKLGPDDWLMVPALILVLGMQVTMIVEYRKRLIGYPDPHYSPGHPDAHSNLPFYPIELMQIPTLGLTKLSFVFLFRRIFIPAKGINRWFDWFTIATICGIVTWILGFFFTWIFICGSHPDHYWKSAKIERSTCVKTPELHNAFAISDVIFDVIILLMCLPLIWRLHLSFTRKLAVTGVFSFGLVTFAASLTRMVIFIQSTAVRYAPDIDFEYLVTDGIYWSMLEVGLGLITANFVVIYGLFATRGFQKFRAAASRVLSLSTILGSRKSSNESTDDEHGHVPDTERPAKWYRMDSVHGSGQIEDSNDTTNFERGSDGVDGMTGRGISALRSDALGQSHESV